MSAGGAEDGLGGGAAGKAGGEVVMGEVVVVGSINADVYLDIERLPLVGETISAEPRSGAVATGGKGANTAVAVSRLRSSSSLSSSSPRVRFMGQWGSDSHAAMLQRTLDEAEVESSLCRAVDGSATGAAFILRMPQGHNSIVLLGGANRRWPQQPLSAEAQRALRTADLVLLQREVPDEVNDAVARAMDGYGGGEAGGVGDDAHPRRRLLVDVGGSSSPLSSLLLSRTLLLAPNETELAGLTGRSTTSTKDLLSTAAEAQRTLGVPYLLVTVGEQGSFLFTPQHSSSSSSTSDPLHCPAFSVSVVDSTGAGDTYRGAFAVAYTALPASARGSFASLYDCMRFGAAAAALSCTKPGTIPSIPSRTEVDAFLAQHDSPTPHRNPYADS